MKTLLQFLKDNCKPATGCTEPISVAYATSLAYHSLFDSLPGNFKSVPEPSKENIEKISIKTDRNVFKNALAIYVPGSNGMKGMAIASAMGIFAQPKNGLNLLSGFDRPNDAKMILDSGKVVIENVEDRSEHAQLDVQVNLSYNVGEEIRNSSVRIIGHHDNISTIALDGREVYHGKEFISEESTQESFPETLEAMVDLADNADQSSLDEAYKGIEMNKRIAEEGLSHDYGLHQASALKHMMEDGSWGKDLVSKVRLYGAAAGEVRMGGADMPVMSTCGSGNQGITALIPLVVLEEERKLSKDEISRAAILSHLVTKYACNHSGYLSAICGCAIKAGFGATAATTYALGGNLEQINNSINILAANLTGMICDGAKEGCSLKLSTAAGCAIESSLYALNGMRVPEDNGIIYAKAEDTMKSVGRISKSMVPVDYEIVSIMGDPKK